MPPTATDTDAGRFHLEAARSALRLFLALATASPQPSLRATIRAARAALDAIHQPKPRTPRPKPAKPPAPAPAPAMARAAMVQRIARPSTARQARLERAKPPKARLARLRPPKKSQ